MHFLSSLDRICNPSYIPTQQDILLLRISTMGVIEVTFNIKDKIWRVFDVGGQRSQRKKWIHCFDDARAVIFVVAFSNVISAKLPKVNETLKSDFFNLWQLC
jgi:hypothetical protein